MKNRLLFAIACAFALAAVQNAQAMPKTTSAVEPTASAAADKEPLAGKVLQTLANAGYTYIQIQKKGGDKTWVAVTETDVKIGSQIVFRGGMEMRDFKSKGLNRTFESIYFADGVASVEAPKGGAGSDKQKPQTTQGSKAAASAKDTQVAVAKATGANAYTVQELFANSAKLNKKKITVKGKVVKVSTGIMSRNWIHVQDGTGNQAAGTHNLVCTSTKSAEIGDIVTVTGTLIKDKDFGQGYSYKVLIEDAVFKK